MNWATWFCIGAVVGLLVGMIALGLYLGGGKRP